MSPLPVKLLLLGLLGLLLASTGCVNPSHETPVRWVTVIDSSSGQPVPGVPLVYEYFHKPYFILAALTPSDPPPYVSGPDGRAFVPEHWAMHPDSRSGWTIDWGRTYGPPAPERPRERQPDVIYVKKTGPGN
jgi:hypothetical protein